MGTRLLFGSNGGGMKKTSIVMLLLGTLLFLTLCFCAGCGEIEIDHSKRTRETIAENPPYRIIKCYETYYGTYWYYLQEDLGDCWDTMAESENMGDVKRWMGEYGMRMK